MFSVFALFEPVIDSALLPFKAFYDLFDPRCHCPRHCSLGFRVIRPVERPVERFGRYQRTLEQGLRHIPSLIA